MDSANSKAKTTTLAGWTTPGQRFEHIIITIMIIIIIIIILTTRSGTPSGIGSMQETTAGNSRCNLEYADEKGGRGSPLMLMNDIIRKRCMDLVFFETESEYNFARMMMMMTII